MRRELRDRIDAIPEPYRTVTREHFTEQRRHRVRVLLARELPIIGGAWGLATLFVTWAMNGGHF